MLSSRIFITNFLTKRPNISLWIYGGSVNKMPVRLYKSKTKDTVVFLMDILKIDKQKSRSLIKSQQKLLNTNLKEMGKSVETLMGFKYSLEDITEKPLLLTLTSTTLWNRYQILLESGVEEVSLLRLAQYLKIINRPVAMLKLYGVIPKDTNVEEHLKQYFLADIHIRFIKETNEKMKLSALRKQILDEYLRDKLKASEKDLEKLWKTYPRIKNKSFTSIKDMINLLKTEFKFSADRILKNGYVLYGDAQNTRRILKEIPMIGSENMKDILYRRPKIFMSTCDTIKKIIEYTKIFDIPESAITLCAEVLTLSPETVFERLKELNSIEEFKVLATNPRVMRLIHYQNKARIRLDYLNQLKVKCASLHILSCTSETFERYAREGSDKTKGKDVVNYLATVLNKPQTEIRKLVGRHPNWCHVALLQVTQCFDTLIAKKFQPEDIYENIHIIFYPIKRIEEKLAFLNRRQNIEDLHIGLDFMEVTNSQILALCLYFIELEFHFTGDGIWSEQPIQMENFNQVLPDFPETLSKEYKFGVKPSLQNRVPSIP